MSQFVTVYSVHTGEPQDVPVEWLDHPVLGRDFRTTEPGEDQKTKSPFDSWSKQQLLDHAEQHAVDVSGATTKADLVAAITKPGSNPEN